MSHSIGLRARRPALTLVALLVGSVTLGVGGPAGAVLPPAIAIADLSFQLDGNTSVEHPTVQPKFDWETFFKARTTGSPLSDITSKLTLPDAAAAPGYISSASTADYALPDHTTYATGSKDILVIDSVPGVSNNWQCAKSNNVSAKDDLVNTYAVAFRDPDSNHLIVYFGAEKSSNNGDNNIGMWLLQDPTAGCTSSGGAIDWTGQHQPGDVLLTAAFTNGGRNADVQAFEWKAGPANGGAGSLDLSPLAENGNCQTDATLPVKLCATTNVDPTTGAFVPIDPPWNHPLKNPAPDGVSLDGQEFYEGGIDLTALGLEGCFNRTVMDTRSSQSPTATLFDFTTMTLPTCGTLHVKKYIDVNLSGTHDAVAGQLDIASGTPVSGWTFQVAGPSPSTTVVCSGTTTTTGEVTCSNMAPGTYTVTEVGQTTGFFNSDPGPIPTTGNVSRTVVMSTGDTSVEFGNTCFVDKSFTINTVPSGQGALDVRWSTTRGPSGTVALTTTIPSGSTTGTATGTLNDTLIQTDSLNWDWGAAGTTTNRQTGAINETVGGGYPSCAASNSATFPFATLTGSKYKDVNANGSFNLGIDTAVGGFQFQLKQGATVLQTATANASGVYSFSNVAPGSYTVHEVPVTGWKQTEPASNSDQSVTVNLGDTAVTIDPFGNTPLSDIGASFSNQAVLPGTSTPATQATIVCKDSANSTVGGPQSGNSYSATKLVIGTYTCTIAITDP